MGTDRRRFTTILMSTVLPILGIVGGCSGWEYLGNREIREIDRTLELYSAQFDEQKSRVAKLRIEMELKPNYKEIDEIVDPSKNTNLSQEEINRRFNDYMLNNFDPKDYEKIITIRRFYEQISKCVRTSICHREKAERLAGDEWRNFFALYNPIFNKLQDRLDDSSIAEPLVEFYKPARS